MGRLRNVQPGQHMAHLVRQTSVLQDHRDYLPDPADHVWDREWVHMPASRDTYEQGTTNHHKDSYGYGPEYTPANIEAHETRALMAVRPSQAALASGLPQMLQKLDELYEVESVGALPGLVRITVSDNVTDPEERLWLEDAAFCTLGLRYDDSKGHPDNELGNQNAEASLTQTDATIVRPARAAIDAEEQIDEFFRMFKHVDKDSERQMVEAPDDIFVFGFAQPKPPRIFASLRRELERMAPSKPYRKPDHPILTTIKYILLSPALVLSELPLPQVTAVQGAVEKKAYLSKASRTLLPGFALGVTMVHIRSLLGYLKETVDDDGARAMLEQTERKWIQILGHPMLMANLAAIHHGVDKWRNEREFATEIAQEFDITNDITELWNIVFSANANEQPLQARINALSHVVESEEEYNKLLKSWLGFGIRCTCKLARGGEQQCCMDPNARFVGLSQLVDLGFSMSVPTSSSRLLCDRLKGLIEHCLGPNHCRLAEMTLHPMGATAQRPEVRATALYSERQLTFAFLLANYEGKNEEHRADCMDKLRDEFGTDWELEWLFGLGENRFERDGTRTSYVDEIRKRTEMPLENLDAYLRRIECYYQEDEEETMASL